MSEIFPANTASPEGLDESMRLDLVNSLRHLHNVAEETLLVETAEFENGLRELQTHPVSPGVFARYFDLVLALRAEDHEVAARLFKEILQLLPRRPKFSVIPYRSEHLVNGDMERYARLIDIGADNPGFVAEPDEMEFQRFHADLITALDLIERSDARLRSEFDVLIKQVIAAVPVESTEKIKFDGVSSLMLWGNIFLNARSLSSALAIAESLVHETAHHILFALSREEPLVQNAIEDSYNSPLRQDARPMDGVYHATFVCARIHYFYNRLFAASGIPKHFLEQVSVKLELNQRAFLNGMGTINKDALLTNTGAEILASAKKYMSRYSRNL
jgi:hypothetical protein